MRATAHMLAAGEGAGRPAMVGIGLVLAALLLGGLVATAWQLAVLPFAAIAAVVLGLLIVRRPFFGVLGWAATVGIQVGIPGLPLPRVAVADLILVPTLVGCALLWYRRREEPIRFTALDPFLLALVTVFALSTLVAVLRLGELSTYAVVQKDIGLLVLILGYQFVVRLTLSTADLHRLLRWFILAGSGINLLAVAGGLAGHVFRISNPMLYEGLGWRVVGLMGNPNAYGGYVATLLVLQIGLIWGRSDLVGLFRSVQFVNCGLLFLGLLLTISRSSWIAFALALLVLSARYLLTWRTLGLVLLASTVAGVLIQVLDPQLMEVLLRIALNRRTGMERLRINEVGLDLLLESPLTLLLGIGMGVFYAVSPRFFDFGLIIHNTYIWVLVELGLLGMLVLMLLIARVLHLAARAVRAPSTDPALPWAVLAALVGLFFWLNFNEGLYQRHLWFLFAVVELMRRLQPRPTVS